MSITKTEKQKWLNDGDENNTAVATANIYKEINDDNGDNTQIGGASVDHPSRWLDSSLRWCSAFAASPPNVYSAISRRRRRLFLGWLAAAGRAAGGLGLQWLWAGGSLPWLCVYAADGATLFECRARLTPSSRRHLPRRWRRLTSHNIIFITFIYDKVQRF